MKQLIMAIVQSLVDKPDEVQIKEVVGEHAHVLELQVAKEDLHVAGWPPSLRRSLVRETR
jgi:predicted RNA-binding protein YlqC (UPF0109 family)